MGNKLLTSSELFAFCEQSAMLLKAGISLDEGLVIMAQDCENPVGKSILSAVSQNYMNGQSLAQAIAETNVFPKYVVDMVKIGEVSGKIENVMSSLSDYYQREEQINENIKGAIKYPLIMISMMIVVVLVLITKVLPVFNEVFAQLGTQLTGVALTVMNIGSAISSYSFVFIAFLLVLTLFFLYSFYTQKGRQLMHRCLEKLWLTRQVYIKVSDAKFADCMALMLSSGIPTEKILELIQELVENPVVKKRIDICKSLVEDGEGLDSAMLKASLFNGIACRMIAIGFKTGNADVVMQKLAQQLSQEADLEINRKIAVIEPTLIAVFSIITGMILLSVMLPLMAVISSVG